MTNIETATEVHAQRPTRARRVGNALSVAPASEAFVFLGYRPVGEQVCFIRRGDTRLFRSREDERGLTTSELQAKVAAANASIGIAPAAAEALELDWSSGFANEITDPKQYAAWDRDRRAIKEAWSKRRKSARPASTGWIQVQTDINGLPGNTRSYRGSIHHDWLLAFNEHQWADANGRRRLAEKHSTERAADGVCKAARALFALTRRYSECFARERAAFLADNGMLERAAEIRARPRSERRAALLQLRKKRRSSLRSFFKAVRAYKQLRRVI